MKFDLATLLLCALMACTTAVFGCDAFGLEKSSLKTRSANDLKCDASKLDVKEIGNHSWTVAGCGQTGNYTCIRGEGIGESQWSCMKEK